MKNKMFLLITALVLFFLTGCQGVDSIKQTILPGDQANILDEEEQRPAKDIDEMSLEEVEKELDDLEELEIDNDLKDLEEEVE